MKRILAALLAIVLLSLLALPAAASIEGFAAEVLQLVNAERARSGLPALSGTNAQLNAAAQLRATEIETRFSHTRPDNTAWTTVFAEFNISSTARAENLAMGQTTPASVVAAWMNSSGHRRNILGPYTHMGTGVHQGANGTIHWAQLFINDGTYTPPTNFWDSWPDFLVLILRYVFFGWLWMDII